MLVFRIVPGKLKNCLILLLFNKILESSIVNFTPFLLFLFTPNLLWEVLFEIFVPISYLSIFRVILHNMEGNCRNTTAFNPAVHLCFPGLPCVSLHIPGSIFKLPVYFMWLHSNNLEDRNRLPRGKAVPLALPLAAWPWQSFSNLCFFSPVMFLKLMVLLWFNFKNNIWNSPLWKLWQNQVSTVVSYAWHRSIYWLSAF